MKDLLGKPTSAVTELVRLRLHRARGHRGVVARLRPRSGRTRGSGFGLCGSSVSGRNMGSNFASCTRLELGVPRESLRDDSVAGVRIFRSSVSNRIWCASADRRPACPPWDGRSPTSGIPISVLSAILAVNSFRLPGLGSRCGGDGFGWPRCCRRSHERRYDDGSVLRISPFSRAALRGHSCQTKAPLGGSGAGGSLGFRCSHERRYIREGARPTCRRP